MRRFIAAWVGTILGGVVAASLTFALEGSDQTRTSSLLDSRFWGIIIALIVPGFAWGARWLIEHEPGDTFDMAISIGWTLAICTLLFVVIPPSFVILLSIPSIVPFFVIVGPIWTLAVAGASLLDRL